MKKIFDQFPLLYILLTFFTVQGIAQVSTLDSLVLAHKNEQLSNEERMKALLTLGDMEYREDSLLYFHLNSSDLFENLGSQEDQMRHKWQTGLGYFRRNDLNNALLQLIEAEALANQLADTLHLIKSLNLQSACYGIKSNEHLFLEKSSKALELAELVQNEKYICVIKGNMGNRFIYWGQNEKAIELFFYVLKCAISKNDSISMARANINIGIGYKKMEDYECALEYLNTGQEITQKINNLLLQGLSIRQIAEVQANKGNYSLAKRNFRKAIRIAEQVNSPGTVAFSQTELAEILEKTSPDSALVLAQIALKQIRKSGNLLEERTLSHLLYRIYLEKKNYKKALEFLNNWIDLNEKINSENNKRTVYKMEYKFDYEKQKLINQAKFEEEISLQKRNSQRRFYLLLLGLFISSFSLFSFIYYRKIQHRHERLTLLHQLDILKEKVAAHSISTTGLRDEIKLDKDRIEEHLKTNLGETQWGIITAIYENPSISNNELAEKLFLSSDGLRTSLKRLYKSFGIETSGGRNKKVSLLMKTVQISLNNSEK